MRKLETISLSEALTGMSLGECCIAPDNLTINQVKRACLLLNKQGYRFLTMKNDGKQLVTRLK